MNATTAVQRSRGLRAWTAAAGVWAVVVGVAPHVLHHAGPIAGAALIAGAGGRAVFFLLGVAAMVPLLLRLRARFRTFIAPVVAVAAFAAIFTVSNIVIAPRVTGSAAEQPATPADHASHHGAGK